MSDSSRQLPRHAQGSMHIMGDRVMLAAIVISAITSVALGFNFVESGLAWGVSAVLMVVAVIAYASAAGALASRLVLAFVQSAFVALHIQLAQGQTELHFGVFVTLALLLVYRTGVPSCCQPWSSRCTMCCSTVCRPQVSACTA